MIKQVITTLGIGALGIVSYAATFMQIKTDDGEKAYLWATCNVGAMYPEHKGCCFAWGETEHKSNFDWSNYKWAIANDESSYSLTKYGRNDQ